ncbi:MAG: sigma-54 dependent transcriptional regulator [Myxococcales bacterium]|jgi:two-component system response regulator AtoC|nr:sigma-54 dependent transcriptional regulator [Myxococcales bacterium]
MKRVLVVDDERKMRRVLQMLLEQMGLESTAAESGEEALVLFRQEKFDLVMTDLRMPGMGGMAWIEHLRQLDAEVPVIVLTAYGTVQTAVEAMKHGAFDFILKPFDLDAVEIVIRNALDLTRYRTENRYLRERYDVPAAFENLVGASPAMQRIFDLVQRIAPTRSAVLITGETGTGKELVARAIHNRSPRAAKLFVPLNCAAIPGELLESELFGHARGAFTGAQAARVGKFEIADGGTLFLDEIGDMPYPLQAKLLRVLQEGIIEPVGSNRRMPVDVRVVSSSNRDLTAGIRAGTFREDLYYRLNVFLVEMPPLRARRNDLRPLFESFLRRFAAELGKGNLRLTADAFQVLEGYDWPGNVRELQNFVERAVVLSTRSEIDGDFVRSLLPATAAPAAEEPALDEGGLEGAVAQLERKLILRALSESSDNKAEAARRLGVSERTLWYKLKKHRL